MWGLKNQNCNSPALTTPTDAQLLAQLASVNITQEQQVMKNCLKKRSQEDNHYMMKVRFAWLIYVG